MDGDEFLRRMRAQDARVFDDLMPDLEKITRGACASLRLFEKHQCNDVVQEVAMKAFLNWTSYRGDSRLTTWLYAIARNACLDEIRRGRRPGGTPTNTHPGDEPNGHSAEVTADESQSDFEQRLCVHQVLAALEAEPPARKKSMRKIDVLKWWVMNSPTTEELAVFLETTVAAAKTRKSAILAAVRTLCEKYCGQDECVIVSRR